MITISDASWANDEKIIDDKVFPRRSQYGRITALSHQHLWDGDEGLIHIIGWKSGLIKRTCRSTFRAETHGMIYAKEASDGIRALITDLRGKFPKQRGDPSRVAQCEEKSDWEAVCADEVKNVWMTDCQSLHDYLVNPVAQGSEDKRLEIDLESLRECLWEYDNGQLKDEITEEQKDKPRWIDTSTMLCDPLTKTGPANFCARLRAAMTSGVLSLVPTVGSQMRKLQQQKARLGKILNKDLTNKDFENNV